MNGPTDDGRTLDAQGLRSLLEELGRRMEDEGLRADFFVTGGGAMLLNGIPRSTTSDLDARVRSQDFERISELARQVGQENGLPAEWLSGGSTPYIPPAADHDHVEQIGGITVRPASDRVLLAMKLVADRLKDREDISHLIQRLRIRTADDLIRLAEDAYGADYLEFGLGAETLRNIQHHAEHHIAAAWRGFRPPNTTTERAGQPPGRVGKGVPEGGRFTERPRPEPRDIGLEPN